MSAVAAAFLRTVMRFRPTQDPFTGLAVIVCSILVYAWMMTAGFGCTIVSWPIIIVGTLVQGFLSYACVYGGKLLNGD